MILLDITNRGVDALDLERIQDDLRRANPSCSGRMAATVFDGRREEDLPAVLVPPASLVIDADCAAPIMIEIVPETLLTLVVSTHTANRHDIADGFTGALERRRPELAGRTADIRYALQEALGNAVIHGNLGLDGTLRGSLDSLRVFAAMMEQRLADPHHSRLPIVIAAEATADGVVLTVEDHGDGFVPADVRPSDNPAAGGMGLSIIRMYSRSVAFDRGGRRIAMTFTSRT